MTELSFYEDLLTRFKEVLNDELLDEEVLITGKTLSVEEAIGTPERRDYPIVKGKERLMQADFRGCKGQAFTDMAGDFQGTLKDILSLSPGDNFERAVLISSINAVLKYLGLIDRTIHCHNEDPIVCSEKLVHHITDNYGQPRIALIGLQPAMLESLSKDFSVRVVDLDKDNIGTSKSGIKVEGPEATKEVLDWCDLIVATGSTTVNATIITYIGKKPAVFYGTTGAGACHLMGLQRHCTEAH